MFDVSSGFFDSKTLSVQIRYDLVVDRRLATPEIEDAFKKFAHSSQGELLIAQWLEGDESNRFQVATVMSTIGVSDLPSYLQPAFYSRRRIQSPVNIAPFHDVWSNCLDSESRLQLAAHQQLHAGIYDALDDEDHLMVIKGIGRLTALCTETFVTPDDRVFIAGNWYSPTNHMHRDEYNRGLDQGTARFGLAGSDWALMRAYHGSNYEDYKHMTFPSTHSSHDKLARSTVRAHYKDEYVAR